METDESENGNMLYIIFIKVLTLQAPISKYKFYRLISIHFLRELVKGICLLIKAFPIR